MAGRKVADRDKVETNADKFVRLAEQRVGMALKYLNLVANLAGPGYDRTPAQVTVIQTALQTAVDKVKERFEGKPQQTAGFRLPVKSEKP